MTVATINALRTAEDSVWRTHAISFPHLRKVLGIIRGHLEAERTKLKTERPWPEIKQFEAVEDIIASLMWNVEHFNKTKNNPDWVGEPIDLNKTLPFVSIRPEELPEREDTGE